MRKVSNHMGTPSVAEACLSVEAYKQITMFSGDEESEINSLISATPGRGTKAQSKANAFFLKEIEVPQLLSWLWSFLTSIQKSPHTPSFLDCVPTWI